jgi:hypothetical protein
MHVSAADKNRPASGEFKMANHDAADHEDGRGAGEDSRPN